MGTSREISSAVLCGNASESLSRTTFSEIYEPEQESVNRNREVIQAGQLRVPHLPHSVIGTRMDT